MDQAIKEYSILVNIIKDDTLSDDVHKEALEDLMRLYSVHHKASAQEALRFTKSAVLHLFKTGKLRGLTEDLKGLKPTYIKVMDSVTDHDMEVIALTTREIQDFYILKEKLLHDLKFLINSAHDDVNTIASDGLDDEDDDVYDIKAK